MKNLTSKFVITFALLTLGLVGVRAQETVSAADSEAAAGLDLYAVAELFKDSATLEKFEQALNDPKTGVNNLDLNNNGEIDFIRVTEQTKDDTHLIILQTPLGGNEFQDVATIAVERENERYNLQVQGDENLYGANYYVVPANSDFSAWNVVRWIFQPRYRVYVSPFGYGNYPPYWAIRRPVELNVYRTRSATFVGRRNFTASRIVVVRSVNKINYRPRASVLVTRRTTVIRAPAARTAVVRVSPAAPARPAKVVVQTKTVTTVVRPAAPRRGRH